MSIQKEIDSMFGCTSSATTMCTSSATTVRTSSAAEKHKNEKRISAHVLLGYARSTHCSARSTHRSARSTRFAYVWSFILLSIFLFSTTTQAQSRKVLEDRRRTLIKEIGKTNELLEDTRSSRKNTINQYFTLQKQIEKRSQLITTLREEVQLWDQSIIRSKEVVFALSEDVEKLKKEYGDMARKAYRMKLTDNTLLFIFSSKSFNDAFRRWNYLKQYDTYRQKQTRLIEGTQVTLSRKAVQLVERKAKKEQLLLSELSQKNILDKELTDSDKILAELRSSEVKLEEELIEKKDVQRKLNKSIERIIAAQIERKLKEAPVNKPKPSTSTNSTVIEATPSPSMALSSNFQSNRGHLPWPVDNGVIVGKFGDQAHPGLRNVRIKNNGIDIQTNADAIVKAIHEGVVLGMQFVPGQNYMLILEHGNYFTVYSNLKDVAVRRGTKVKPHDQLGTAAVDKISGNNEVHLEIWENKNPMNPAVWLMRR